MNEANDRTYDMLLELIEQITEEPADDLAPETRLNNLRNWSSIAAIRVLSGVEGRFGREVDLQTFLAAQTVGELDLAVRRKSN